jgi:ABC-type sugar transport system ATPase subunit
LRAQTRVEIARLHNELGNTIIYVTHDQIEAMTLADRIVVMNAGRVEQTGTPAELYLTPRTRFVAGFIGTPKMNFVSGVANGGKFALASGETIDLPARLAATSGEAVLGIRPEHLTLADGGGALIHGAVQVHEYLGERSYLYVLLADRTQVIATTTEIAPRQGRVGMTFDPANLHLFDAAGRALGN